MRENPSKQRVRNRRGKTVFTLAAHTLGNLGEFPATGIDQGFGSMTALAWPDFLLVPPRLGKVTGTDRVKALASFRAAEHGVQLGFGVCCLACFQKRMLDRDLRTGVHCSQRSAMSAPGFIP